MNIYEAARRGNVEMVRNIVDNDPACINALDWGGNTALHLSCMLRQFEVAHILLKHGANLKLPDSLGRSALFYVHDHHEIATLELTAEISNPNYVEHVDEQQEIFYSVFNPLKITIFSGDESTFKGLLQKNPEYVNKSDLKGHTVLMFACMAGQLPIAEYLIDKGADLYKNTTYGGNALKFMKDPQKRDSLRTYDFWASPTGQAQLAAAAAQRQQEAADAAKASAFAAHLALQARTQASLAALGQVVIIRAEKAEVFALRYIGLSVQSLVIASVLQYERQLGEIALMQQELEHSCAAWEWKRNSDAVAAAKLRALHEANQRAAQQVEEQALAQAKEDYRLRMELIAQAKAQGRAVAKSKAVLRAQQMALREWNDAQDEIRQRAWTQFVTDKPKRVKMYIRMRLAVKGLAGRPEVVS